MQQNDENEFLIGVVEGFYGRPWTTEQRKELFKKLKTHGMNSFVYAPKDDCKHRAFWRELYTVEEAEHLIGLVNAAKENNIDFYYSLSPGLDITYSSEKEILALKRKLEQVTQFGCSAVALLFDDIEPEMSKKDKEVFQSFAHAQVSVTNEIFHHLKITKFLFCPTQYCSSRAVPDVKNSEYLNTLGKQLDMSINILWTGEKVISKDLTIESIQKITEVLKRKPIIWDNIFANDYDQKRVFLGPFNGRSPELISLLRGVLVNPNCEFNANMVGIATLAYWAQCSTDTKIRSSISADVKLETEIEEGLYSQDEPSFLSFHQGKRKIYHPRLALKDAINEWLPEFFEHRSHLGPLQKPHPPATMVVPIPILHINTCMTVTATKSTTTMASSLPEVNTTQLHAFAEVCSSVSESLPTVTSPVVMNSLVSPTKVVTTDLSLSPNNIHKICNSNLSDDHIIAENPQGSQISEKSSSNAIIESTDIPFLNNEADTVEIADMDSKKEITDELASSTEAMDAEVVNSPKDAQQTSSNEDILMRETSQPRSIDKIEEDNDVTTSDLLLLCDLFYLPFEHGEKALHLLNEFQWLKSNAQILVTEKEKPESEYNQEKSQEWIRRANAFKNLCQIIRDLTKKIAFCKNREICYDLYTYVWEVSSITSLLSAFIQWLELRKFSPNIQNFTQGSYTYFSKGWNEAFTSGNNEPWVFRGGLTADLQRLIPIDAANDLFNYTLPETPHTTFYSIRVYEHNDEKDIYSVCYKCCLDGSDCSKLFPPGITESIPADRLVGPFLTLNPEFCLVIESDKRIIGYACAALDAKTFYRNQEMAWVPEMCLKYPLSLLCDQTLSSTARDTINHFHNFKYEFPQEVLMTHPSIITCCILKEHLIFDQNISKRLITVLLAALRSNGSFGAFCCINRSDSFLYEFYSKLGFIEIFNEESKVYLARNF